MTALGTTETGANKAVSRAKDDLGAGQVEARSELETLAGAVDRAQRKVGELDDDAKEAADGLKKALEAFHRPALVHIVRSLREDPRGKELLFELVDEPIVRAVLGLHGIIRADPMTRANQELESVRPYLQSHGGDVELVKLDGDTAYVRLHGSCNGCSMSAITLRDGVEEALVSGVEEISRVEVLEDEPTVAFIPLDSIGRQTSRRSLEERGWVRGPAVSEAKTDAMLRFDVTSGANNTQSFVVTNVDNRLAVFRNECVHQGMSLDGGLVDNGVIVCPWHGFRFEANSGDCVSNPGAQLQQVPTRIEDDHLWVQLDDKKPGRQRL